MHKNNMCVIYDSDVKYATKLMNVINSDKGVPFGAQVFTEEEQLSSYLKSYEPKILMVGEDVYNYKITENQGSQLVVLCNDEDETGQSCKSYGDNAIGIYKYQSSNRILQEIVKQGNGDFKESDVKTTIIGVIGSDVCSRNQLSIILAYLLGEDKSVLYINLDEFAGLNTILAGDNNSNLSDAFYLYKQNGFRYCDDIRKVINHIERIDYIAPVECADDISYMEADRVVQFMSIIGKELGYEIVLVDISSGVRASWHILEHCDKVYTAEADNYLLKCKQKAMEQYFLEIGMEFLLDRIIKLPITMETDLMCEDFLKNLPYSQNARKIKELISDG